MAEDKNQAQPDNPYLREKLTEKLVIPLQDLRSRISSREFTKSQQIIDVFDTLFNNAQESSLLKLLLMIEA
ncbi:MAG: hypothetical protein ACI9BD_000776, partial [Candidatus Marinamargulisbacteria bacterium]